MSADLRLVRLLQLASPALPVGAFSYSQGLEAAIEAAIVKDTTSAGAWTGDLLTHSFALCEAPMLARLIEAWRRADEATVSRWNDEWLASREAAELRAETVQMGYSMRRLLGALLPNAAGLDTLAALEEPAFPAAYAFAAAHWRIETQTALVAYAWAWLENQVMAAVKAIPLGQTDGQRLLLALGERIPALAARAAEMTDDEISNFAPGLALLASRHETQYSRLFRS